MTKQNLNPTQYLGMASLLILSLISLLVYTWKSIIYGQNENAIKVLIFAIIIDTVLFLLPRFRKPKVDWNSLSFREQCQHMAKELKTGKRKWYCSEFSEGKRFFYPLMPSNLDEMGAGKKYKMSPFHTENAISFDDIHNHELVKQVLEEYKKMK